MRLYSVMNAEEQNEKTLFQDRACSIVIGDPVCGTKRPCSEVGTFISIDVSHCFCADHKEDALRDGAIVLCIE